MKLKFSNLEPFDIEQDVFDELKRLPKECVDQYLINYICKKLNLNSQEIRALGNLNVYDWMSLFATIEESNWTIWRLSEKYRNEKSIRKQIDLTGYIQ